MTSPAVRMNVHVAWRLLYVLEFISLCVLTAIFLLAGRFTLAAILGLGTLLVVYVLFLSQSRIEVDAERLVLVRPPYGRYAMRWDEVETAEATSRVLVLRGHGKAIAFNTLMGDSQAKALQMFSEQQLRAHGTNVQQVKKVSKMDMREFKNAKLPG